MPDDDTHCTILQFGGGNFLRAFVDLFVQELNDSGPEAGGVLVVQSTRSSRAELLNAQSGRYHVVIRGLRDGHVVDEVHPVSSIRKAVVAADRWDDLCAAAAGEHLDLIVSNTTEAGMQLTEDDRMDAGAPASFPGKLTLLLLERYRSVGKGITVLPCELVDDNGAVLRSLVLEQADRWSLGSDFRSWLDKEVHWLTTLVDRIVSGRPTEHPLLSEDALLTAAEPFAFWAVENRGPEHRLFEHPAVQRVSDVTPFSLRKVRILNGAHTALVARALPMGIETVREAVEHAEVGPWLRRLLEEEIVPAVADRVDGAESFAASALERFANPFLEHRLADIALHHETKLEHRLRPTLADYRERFGEAPPLLADLLGA